jgi:hypothetical protein
MPIIKDDIVSQGGYGQPKLSARRLIRHNSYFGTHLEIEWTAAYGA